MMRTILGKFGCLILIILFLPLFAIFIGPLLVLAAFRGHQPIGPLTLDTDQYGPTGRAGSFLLGLAIWLLVWGSLTWLAIASMLPAPTVAVAPPGPPATRTPAPPATPTSPATATSPPPTVTPSATATATPLPPTTGPTEIPALPATSTATPTATATALFSEIPATDTPTPGAEEQATANGAQMVTPPARPARLTLADRRAAIVTVEEGNALLRQAISQANEENLQQLAAVWEGRALTSAQEFATELYDRYAKPFDVQFEYISAPRLGEPNELGEIVIVSRERWFYGGPTKTNQEAFEFIYTLNQRDDDWVISHYTYRNLSLPTVTPGPTPVDQS